MAAMDERKGFPKMTTLRKLDELTEKQEIKDLLKEGDSGFHRFVLNENSEFNRIDKELSEIESFLDRIDDEIIKTERSHGKRDSMDLEDTIMPVHLLSNLILERLLVRVKDMILFEKDANILYKKISELIFRVALYYPGDDKRVISELDDHVTVIGLDK